MTELLDFKSLSEIFPTEIQHLILVPTSYLHLFPLHALWIDDRQRLIDRFCVSYVPNLQLWKICQNRQRSREGLIAVENPTADKKLIFAKAEIASICQRRLFAQHQVLKGERASKAEILNVAPNHQCFHFSGHAEYSATGKVKALVIGGSGFRV